MLSPRSSLPALLAVLLFGSAAAQSQDRPAKGADGTPFIEANELIGEVDFGPLDAAQTERAIRLLNSTLCDCGCKMTLARCRRDDKACPRSPKVVPLLISAMAAGKSDAQSVKAGLSLPEPRIEYAVEAGDSPSRGPADAPVTVITWLDYQCPFCAKVGPALRSIVEEYPDEVRLVIKQNPLDMHSDARFAAAAALAAQEQGKFWELHERMLSNTRQVKSEKIREWAREIGMNVAKMDAAIESGKFKARIDAEQRRVVGLSATGTPASFVNGRFVSGAKPFDYFKKRIDEEIVWARDQNRPSFRLGSNVKTDLRPPKGGSKRPDVNQWHDIGSGSSPALGADDARIDIVVWTDYQCPACRSTEPQVVRIVEDNPDTVRLFVRQHPLRMHADAPLAAEAALAAGEQGKFWEMHVKLFASNIGLKRPALEQFAEEIGLKMKPFRRALDQRSYKAVVDGDTADANAIKATFTPAIFVGGYNVRGGPSAVQAKIDELLGGSPAPARAAGSSTRPAVAAKTGGADSAEGVLAGALALSPAERAKLASQLLASLQDDLAGASGSAKKAPAVAPAAKPPTARAERRTAADGRNLPAEDGLPALGAPPPAAPGLSQAKAPKGWLPPPARGAENAKVTVIVASDFQCPVCPRAVLPMEALIQEFPEDVRVEWRQRPLKMHRRAEDAAVASLAAHAQGRFWDYHDLLFEEQQRMSPADFERHARTLGLDMDRFRSDLKDPALRRQVRAENRASKLLGARGTPAFFVNGRKRVGWGSYQSFKGDVLRELRKVNAALAEGVPLEDIHAVRARENAEKPDEFVEHFIEGAPAPESDGTTG